MNNFKTQKTVLEKKKFIIGMAVALMTMVGPTLSTVNFAHAAETVLSGDDVDFLKEAVSNLNIQVSLTSVAGTQINDVSLNVAQQNLGVSISNQDKLLVDIIKEKLGNETGFDIRNGFLAQVRIAGTVSPIIVGPKVKKDATAAVNAKVDQGAQIIANQQKQAYYKQAPQLVEADLRSKITAAVNASPATGALSAEQKSQYIDGQVKQNLPVALEKGLPIVYKQIDAKVNAGVAAAVPGMKTAAIEEHVNSRLDAIQLETEVQKLDATFAIPINPFADKSTNPPGLIMFAFGKNHPELGATLNTNGLSDWESIIGHTNEGERGNTVASTGYASVGVAYSITKELNLVVNFIGYHDRDPWMSAQQYINKSLAVARSVFDKYQDVSALNAMGINLKANAKIKGLTGEFWATLTNRFDSNIGDKNRGYSFGGTITVDKSKTTINFAYANSGKAYFNETYSVGIAQTLIEKESNSLIPGLIVYTDFRGVSHLADPNDTGSVKSSKELVAIGAKVDICKFVKKDLIMNCALVGEYQKTVNSTGGDSNLNRDDFYTGISAGANYDL